MTTKAVRLVKVNVSGEAGGCVAVPEASAPLVIDALLEDPLMIGADTMVPVAKPSVCVLPVPTPAMFAMSYACVTTNAPMANL